MSLFSIFCKRYRYVPFSALSPSSYSTSTSIAPKPPKIKALTSYHRKSAMEAAMTALKDYLYSTCSLPFSLAEQISLNSPISLSSYICRLQFPTSSFNSSDFRQFFRRSFSFKEPINEFDFLFESIGVSDKPKPSKSLFLSDDLPLVEGVNQLIHLGFPCKKIGLLYPSKALWVAPNELLRRFEKVWNYGFSERNCVVAICLAFPKVLTGDDADSLLGDLGAFFVANDVVNSMENKVDIYLEICEKIQIFYELGSAEGSIGSLLRKNDWVIFDTDKKELRKRLGFFAKLGMEDDLGQFVLRNSREIFKFDFELTISIPEYLHYVGLDENEANNVISAYPHVVGKNKLGNLSSIMCAVGLSGWFLSTVRDGNSKLFSPSFVSDALNYDPAIEEEFVKGLEQANLLKKGKLVIYKVEFLQSIGFGMNKFTARCAAELRATKEDLHERFELLLNWGIEPKRICKMLRTTPKLLNQNKDSMKGKINFLCNHLGHNLDNLDTFPAFLCFDLENRIKPRYGILDWLKEVGVLRRSFAPATVVGSSEKRFMVILYAIHPAAPKQWLEKFSSRNHREYYRKNLFAPKIGRRAGIVGILNSSRSRPLNTGVRIKQAGQSARGDVADVAGKVNSMVKTMWAVFKDKRQSKQERAPSKETVQERLISVAASTTVLLRKGLNETKKKAAKRTLNNIERWQKGVASNSVFGVPIEVIVQREQSNTAVPQVLIACVDYLMVSGLSSEYLFKSEEDKKNHQALNFPFQRLEGFHT